MTNGRTDGLYTGTSAGCSSAQAACQKPMPDAAQTIPFWTARDGGTCAGIGYQVAGMQSMVNAVRSTGATNVLMLGGEEYSNDISQWLTYQPTDSANNLVASWHSYNFNTCATQSCWTSQVAPVIAQVPVVVGEIGENDCGGSYLNTLTTWLNSQSTGYLAWTWDTWGSCPNVLITSYDGTPTVFGAAYKAILQALP